jgi:glutamate synthase (NADPH/NADH) small chain
VRALQAVNVETRRDGGKMSINRVAGTEFELEADLVLLAMGFLGPERSSMLSQLGVRMTDRGNVWRDDEWMTSEAGVFTAGDMQRGQSLIVWAIADGRNAAKSVDRFLAGRTV